MKATRKTQHETDAKNIVFYRISPNTMGDIMELHICCIYEDLLGYGLIFHGSIATPNR